MDLQDLVSMIDKRLSEIEQNVNSARNVSLNSFDSKGTLKASDIIAKYGMARAARLFGIDIGEFTKSRWPGDDGRAVLTALATGSFAGVVTTSGSSGGAAIPFSIEDDIVEFLRARAVVRSLGAREIGPVSGPVPFLRISEGIQPFFVGEGNPIPVSGAKYEVFNAIPRKIGAMVPLTSEWVRGSVPGAEEALRQDILSAAVEMEDMAFIAGTGTQHQPTGLLTWATVSGNTVAALGGTSPTISDVLKTISEPIRKFKDSKLILSSPGFIFAPRTEQFLMNLTFTNGGYAFRDEMASRGTVNGVPYAVSPQIPTNLGSGSDESYIIAAEFSQVYIVDGFSTDIEASNSATFVDSSMGVTSAFQNDLVLLRYIRSAELVLRHINAACVITGVKWGA